MEKNEMGNAQKMENAQSGPCQLLYDQYVRCANINEKTIDMIDCEDIAYEFRKCMRDYRQEQATAVKTRNPE